MKTILLLALLCPPQLDSDGMYIAENGVKFRWYSSMEPIPTETPPTRVDVVKPHATESDKEWLLVPKGWRPVVDPFYPDEPDWFVP